MDERVNQLEALVALQDKTLEELNAEIFRQQQDITRLTRRLENLEKRIDQMSENGEIGGNEKPPHW